MEIAGGWRRNNVSDVGPNGKKFRMDGLLDHPPSLSLGLTPGVDKVGRHSVDEHIHGGNELLVRVLVPPGGSVENVHQVIPAGKTELVLHLILGGKSLRRV